MAKIDLKKELKQFYHPSTKEVSVVDVPEMNVQQQFSVWPTKSGLICQETGLALMWSDLSVKVEPMPEPISFGQLMTLSGL